MEKFSELKYERPKVGALKKQLNACVRRLRQAKSFEEANAAFLMWHEVILRASTSYTLAQVRNTCNMKDEFYEREMKFFNSAVPMLMPLLKKSLQAVLGSPFRPQFEQAYGSHLFKTAESYLKLLSFGVILPTVRENRLTSAYSKTAAGCSTEFMGETCNLYGLLRHMKSPDRAERQAAFAKWAELYEGVSPQLEKQYGKLVKLRCGIAKNLGFASYTDYAYLSRGRFDYTQRDVAAFRDAVLQYITPLCEKLYAAQAERLGTERLQYYDEMLCYPGGDPAPQGTPAELVEKARQMYAALSPETDAFFAFMKTYELFDLETRPNKHLGGYCTALPEMKAPFIFSNFNGTAADVDVLTHEAGHAFECYYAMRRQPLPELATSTSEINEIHSMSMELFTYPYMDKFFGDEADRYRYAHFCDAIKTIPYLVAVDEFQHRVFAEPTSGPADWRRFWKETERKYMPWRSYDGNAFLESGGFWMQKQHIFLYPFYYVDYALAQMGAFALYRRQLETGDGWAAYLALCGMGGKYGYFETLSRAGIPLPLLPQTVKETAAFAEAHAAKLYEKAFA